MTYKEDSVRIEEKVNLKLRKLYSSFGYRELKMGKFEEYDLYNRNRDFIPNESIIAFPGPTGKLLAIRPDLTLSIVKNHRPEKNVTDKISYSERVCRLTRDGEYRESLQTGLECLGKVDMLQITEVIELAALSLSTISDDFILDISDLGLIKSLLENEPVELMVRVTDLIAGKNEDGISAIEDEGYLEPEKANIIRDIISASGRPDEVIPELKMKRLPHEAVKSLERLEMIYRSIGDREIRNKLNIDFSIVNNMKYYSGILFQGYIKGIPNGVLSGGQYDGIMERMGKPGNAVGFAVYTDMLPLLYRDEKEFDVDAFMVYDDDEDVSKVSEAAWKLRKEAGSLATGLEPPSDIKYKKLYRFRKGELIEIESC
jgi:ATP phosphoribosyltransferase regulatory subunit